MRILSLCTSLWSASDTAVLCVLCSPPLACDDRSTWSGSHGHRDLQSPMVEERSPNREVCCLSGVLLIEASDAHNGEQTRTSTYIGLVLLLKSELKSWQAGVSGLISYLTLHRRVDRFEGTGTRPVDSSNVTPGVPVEQTHSFRYEQSGEPAASCYPSLAFTLNVATLLRL